MCESLPKFYIVTHKGKIHGKQCLIPCMKHDDHYFKTRGKRHNDRYSCIWNIFIRPKETYYVIASVSVILRGQWPYDFFSLPLCNSWRISKKPDTNVYQTETMWRSNVLDGFTFETRDVEATVFSVQQRPDVVIVFIYKSPKVSSKALLDLLQQIQTKSWPTNCTVDKQSKDQLLITTQQSTSSSLTSKHTTVE